MRIDELVSDWELEEIRQELRSGEAPDVVAYRHGIPRRALSGLHRRHVRQFEDRWTEAEKAFVRDNWPNHGKGWDGWKMLNRSWDAIKMRASYLGVKRKSNSANEGWRKSNGTFLRPRKG